MRIITYIKRFNSCAVLKKTDDFITIFNNNRYLIGSNKTEFLSDNNKCLKCGLYFSTKPERNHIKCVYSNCDKYINNKFELIKFYDNFIYKK